MPSSLPFSGASFSVKSATPISSTRVRVTFTQPPLRINPAGAVDALNPARYILVGPAARSVVSVDGVVADVLSVDLNVNGPFVFGSWTVTASGIQTSGGSTLASPTSAVFAVAAQQTSLTAGSESDTAYTVIRKHLNAALAGPNWNALIEALSEADQYIWDMATNAFDQLFLSTASGTYLRRKAAESGISEYPGLGLSDEQFRDLALKLSTGRVTYISILEILESYYGHEALRAHVDSAEGPFVLSNGQTVTFNFEGTSVIYIVNQDDYALVGAATVEEVAVALTNFFDRMELGAWAAVKNGAVRVYSGVLGLRSSVTVSGAGSLGFDALTHTVHSLGRTVAVSNSVPNVLDVQVPATADLERDPQTAGYIVGADLVDIRSVERKNGTLTVQTATPHLLSAGGQVQIEGFMPGQGRPWVSPASGANLGGSPVVALAATGQISGSASDVSFGGSAVQALSTGTAIIAGGAAVGDVATNLSYSFAPTLGVVADGSQADGAGRVGYTTTVLPTLPYSAFDMGSSVLSGPFLDNVFVTGGYSATSTVIPTTALWNGSTWTAKSSMISPRGNHSQVTIPFTGEVLVSGGVVETLASQSTRLCEIYNPQLNAWRATGSMATARNGHKMHYLSSGQIIAIGGYSMGQPTPRLAGVVGEWKFDSVGGGTTPETLSLFDLTTAATTVPGKVGRALGSTGTFANTARYVANATLRDAFAMANGDGMSVDFWVKGLAGTGRLVSYANTVAVTDDDMILFDLYSMGSDSIRFKYQETGLNDLGPVTCSVTSSSSDGWHHIAVVGILTNGGANTDYFIYSNGRQIGTLTGPTTSGGADSFLMVGGSPLVGDYFSGEFDDLRLWNRPLSASEVREQFLQGAGLRAGVSTTSTETKRTLSSCELFDPNTGIWSQTGQMAYNRADFQSLLLDSGELMVFGGLGYPTNGSLSIESGQQYWPLQRLSSVEIYDPATGKWRLGPAMPVTKSRGWSAKVGNNFYIGDTNLDFDVVSGAQQFPSDTSILVLDLTKMKWSQLPSSSSSTVFSWGIGLTNMALVGTNQSSSKRYYTAIIGDSAKASSVGINSFHRIATTPTTTSFTVADTRPYCSSFGSNDTHRFAADAYSFANSKAASRTSNVTTVTAAVPTGTLAVYINSTDVNFSSGVKVLTGLTATTISYAEVAADNTGTVFVESPLSIPETQAVASAGTGGVFVLDPARYTALAGSSTTSGAMSEGFSYSIVDVTSTEQFPDEPGYVVFGLGTEVETAPVKYLEKISLTQLLMAGFVSSANLPVGTTVDLISRDASDTIAKSAWLTGTIALRLAAQRDVSESVANDVDLNWSVIYPGDRGLGGEGASNSDATDIWGPDRVG